MYISMYYLPSISSGIQVLRQHVQILATLRTYSAIIVNDNKHEYSEDVCSICKYVAVRLLTLLNLLY